MSPANLCLGHSKMNQEERLGQQGDWRVFWTLLLWKKLPCFDLSMLQGPGLRVSSCLSVSICTPSTVSFQQSRWPMWGPVVITREQPGNLIWVGTCLVKHKGEVDAVNLAPHWRVTGSTQGESGFCHLTPPSQVWVGKLA